MSINHRIESLYEYTAGIALSKFLHGLKTGRIICSRCRKCGKTFIPPRAYCPACLAHEITYSDVESEAYIETYTISHIALDGERLETPITWVFVKYHGVDGGMLHRLDPAVNPSRSIKVRPVFRDERIGSIWDIAYFTSP
jgi:uncharacterized OB-fold protein